MIGLLLDVDTGAFHVYLNGVDLGDTTSFWTTPPGAGTYTFATSVRTSDGATFNFD